VKRFILEDLLSVVAICAKDRWFHVRWQQGLFPAVQLNSLTHNIIIDTILPRLL